MLSIKLLKVESRKLKREILFTSDTVQQRVREMAGEITADYEGEEPILIGVLNGVIFFFADLVRSIAIPTKIDFIRASSYGSGTVSKGEISLTKDVEIQVEGEHVIIVEDIVDTGLTLNRIVDHLEEKGAKSCRICALIDKSERRKKEVSVDYCGFKLEGGFVVGYGLDYGERYRYLSDICVLK